VQIVSSSGGSRSVSVGRVKIERRPMILIAAKLDSHEGSAVLQNAETIRLVKPDGSTAAVTDLKEGDEVLVHIAGGAAGRHFGGVVDEFIIER
jgi:3-dehydroquinate synthase II